MDEEDDPQQWDVFRRRSELEKARKTLGEISGRMDRFVQTEAKSLKGLFPSGNGDLSLKVKGNGDEIDGAGSISEELDMEERSRVISLIWRGFSHYQGIISKLGIVPSDFNSSPIHGFSQPAQTSPEKASEEWARTVFYKCLLCLGDLARYFREMNCGGYLNIARRYYHQALIASSYKSGMPYNQLGRLSEEEYWGLPSAYYYLRSAMSEDRFDGAEINLKNLLTKNEKFYLKLNDEDKGQEETELFVVSLLHMMRCFLFEPDTKTSDLRRR
ncbi:SMG5 [Lepeophtheirus salmonis]|uniref:SMG5 n=1 Tax=Lepeophtheirus salmonis TaxID=72036 RepID=A0A7R8H7E2_LEPSM|nr:SMG5 [Lepeophtheirus salmonis]CAF2916695.1 SMG5 [Lepeophtheirus salmonis]